MAEKIFAEGFGFKVTQSQPSYVVGKVTIRVDAAIEFLEKHQKNNWVNLDIKQSNGGKYYLELDTYERKQQTGDPAADANANVRKATKNSQKNDMPDNQTDDFAPNGDDLPF